MEKEYSIKLQPLMHSPLILYGIPAEYTFYKDCKKEVLVLNISSIAKAAIYKYFDDDSTVYLSNLMVYSQYRNQGIGEKLQNEQERIGRYVNAESAYLWVKKSSWMHEWYLRRGYSDFRVYPKKGYTWMVKSLFN